jgi:hypothetical protein
VTEEGRQGLFADPVSINRKMLVPFPVAPEFFLGAKVRRKFEQGIFVGTVADLYEDEGETLWRVVYSDFDAEDLSLNELTDGLVYHPRLDHAADLELPEVGSFVWYSQDRAPCLGKVVELDPTLPRPLTVHVYDPQPSKGGLQSARFEARRPEAGAREVSGIHDQLFLAQIRFGFEALTAEGYLRKKDRKRLKKCLSL